MKFLFADESFSFETLRTTGFASYGGAELGEVLATAAAIKNKDESSWLTSWRATADRVNDLAERQLAAGHRVSAREAFLRASNYYRTSEFFRRESPTGDPVVKAISSASRDSFAAAARLFDTPVEPVAIPYEGTTLPGYLFLVDASGEPRPTIIYNNGYDSTLEESYFAVAAAALRRGYNVLAFDGPGQGAALREQGLVFRPDWEAVISPVIDFALTRSEIAPDQIILFGYSLGGYLVARAAAFDRRVAAIVLNDGVFDFYGAFAAALPGFLKKWIDEKNDRAANRVIRMLARRSTRIRWAINNGLWVMGVESPAQYIRMTKDYTIADVAGSITCPTLILDADNDAFFKGQPQQVAAAIGGPATLTTLSDSEGAGEHCHVGAMSRLHQEMFDWLDDTVLTPALESRARLSHRA